jgi:hypothetical protein
MILLTSPRSLISNFTQVHLPQYWHRGVVCWLTGEKMRWWLDKKTNEKHLFNLENNQIVISHIQNCLHDFVLLINQTQQSRAIKSSETWRPSFEGLVVVSAHGVALFSVIRPRPTCLPIVSVIARWMTNILSAWQRELLLEMTWKNSGLSRTVISRCPPGRGVYKGMFYCTAKPNNLASNISCVWMT